MLPDPAAAEVAALRASTTPDTVRMDAIRRCESEAEVAMLGGLLRHFDPQALEDGAIGRRGDERLYQQHVVTDTAGRFIGRADFAIITSAARFAVEVDGFAYHDGDHRPRGG